MYKLHWMASALVAAGCAVKEYPGWKTNGHGDMKGVRGVLCHHTAGPLKGDMPSLGVLTVGRADLDGPLSQLGLSRSGVYHVLAAGKAYHAGKGAWKPMNLADNGNSWLIGIEAENNGTGEPWPEVQMQAYAKGVAALLKYCDLKVDAAIGHKEYAPGRKTDPSFDMVAFRKRVAVLL